MGTKSKTTNKEQTGNKNKTTNKSIGLELKRAEIEIGELVVSFLEVTAMVLDSTKTSYPRRFPAGTDCFWSGT